jgi:hypothetical protein
MIVIAALAGHRHLDSLDGMLTSMARIGSTGRALNTKTYM